MLVPAIGTKGASQLNDTVIRKTCLAWCVGSTEIRFFSSSNTNKMEKTNAEDRRRPCVRAGSKAFHVHILSWVLTTLSFLFPFRMWGQTEPSALMELQSTDKGFLLPRMSKFQRDAITEPATGLMIYNTTAGCLEVNYGNPDVPAWFSLGCAGTIGSLDCGGATVAGNLRYSPDELLLAAAIVPYAGGNGGIHMGQVVSSIGVTGLTATLSAGSFALGNGSLVYTVAGNASSAGTAVFALQLGGQGCTLSVPVSGCGAFVGTGQWKAFQ
jgi:hypothetical protein